MAALGAVACTVARPGTAHAIEPIGRTRPSHLKLSLAAYSYRDYLAGPKKRMDLFDFLNLAADLAVDAVEPTSYYFPQDVTTDYLNRLKQRAFLLGLDISGTAVMNDFCVPPGPESGQGDSARSGLDRSRRRAGRPNGPHPERELAPGDAG